MNHFSMILYVLCCIACAATILISGLLYRKFGHKAFKYLSLLMVGAMLLMLVEAVRTYSNIANTDMEIFKRIVYLTLNPIGEMIQFFMFPAVAFAAVGKKFPHKLNVISKIYGIAIVATFPLAVITGNSDIKLAREFFGQSVFHMYAYIVILKNYRSITNEALKKALKSYLILALVVLPPAIAYQSGILNSLIHKNYLEIPFPYIFYCLLFNILCVANTFKYLFIPVKRDLKDIPDQYVLQYNITNREKEIIELLLKGYSNKQIGKTLFISAKTVKNHIYSIYQKNQVQNRIQLANSINYFHSII
ncbi:MAG: helix-turn-helix transcriptional regulator [Spirochaetales bacterium]|nr:helix-turn-helix transcriptional regulator [Spirochaetales bacterium]